MKLKINKSQKNIHSNIVYLVNWAPNNQLYSYSDDKKILTWDINAEYTGKFMDLDTYYTAGEWNTSLKSGNELLVMGTEDGQLKLFSKGGKLEKVVQNAHNSSIISIQWSPDGNTIATAGEDGQLKTWSKQAELRNHLVKGKTPIYACKWNNDSSFIVYATEKTLNIEPVLKGGMKTHKWKAHDETVLCVDWNHANKLIISGGEDRKYKIWDQYGRNIYVSYTINSVVTSINWAQSGEYFAVGSFDNIRLCSKTGWAHSISKLDSGGVMSMNWSSDGTLLAAAGVSVL
jgi:intraflagellar transport protein 80